MKKIEANTLDAAYKEAANFFNCSIVDLRIEIVQNPSNGFLGLFKKPAIIVAVLKEPKAKEPKVEEVFEEIVEEKIVEKEEVPETPDIMQVGDTIMPASFVTDQDDDAQEEVFEENLEKELQVEDVLDEIRKDMKNLFKEICFDIDSIEVSAYNENTVQITFNGKDAALLIGKEGYRYKALSYMFFNWINTKYNFQLRLEVAEFLQNQEEAIERYLVSVEDNVAKDGRAQTKILDGVLVQIALQKLRKRYPNKYVAVRTTRDGNKYIIINDYNY